MSAIKGMGNPSIYPNYVYNTNQVSANSLNKINPIPQDGTKARVNYYSNDLNQNSLRPGQTRNYGAVVESQQSQSDRNASRMLPGQNPQDGSLSAQASQMATRAQSTGSSDPAQDPNKSLSEIVSERDKASAPNADIMKVPSPEEKVAKEREDANKSAVEKSPAQQIEEMNQKAAMGDSQNDPAQNMDMNISQVAAALNQSAAPNANIMDPSQAAQGSKEQSLIPNVSLS